MLNCLINKMNIVNSKALSQEQINSLSHYIDKVSARQLRDFGSISSELKPDGTLVTECDKWSDEFIVNSLANIAKDEGVLSEEGSKIVPSSSAYWIVDPLDGTTNFTAGIPFWAISIARFVEGRPETAFLDIPILKKRILAIRGKGVWINREKIEPLDTTNLKSECVSLCSRSISVLQKKPRQSFPGKIRLLGVSSLNMTSIAMGQTFGALESTPKIWDIAAAWLILDELKCYINWLDTDPSQLNAGDDLSSASFPLVAAMTEEKLNLLLPWGELLTNLKY